MVLAGSWTATTSQSSLGAVAAILMSGTRMRLRASGAGIGGRSNFGSGVRGAGLTSGLIDSQKLGSDPMPRLIIWRVRVRRAVEVWVDVQAVTAAEAEASATNLPGVISVFGKSAIRGDEAALPERPAGVRDE